MKRIIGLVILLGIFCSFTTSQEKQTMRKFYIGQLHKTSPLTLRNPSEYCLEDGYLYKSADFRLGTLFIYSDNDEDISHLQGKIVKLEATLEKDLNQIIVKRGKCPPNYGREQSMMQIRSDWVGEETGFNVGHSSHEKLKKVHFLRYYNIEEFSGFQVKQVKESFEVSFTNPFTVELKNIEIVGHYEFTGGKPYPKYVNHEIASLKPGETTSIKFVPRIKDENSKKFGFSIHSFMLNVADGNIEIDIEVFPRD